ncbi:hypothetical protein [uncultured Rothia sp.]|mgnify:FL=1|uniref:hypothetical protein n=1 Tax=uncultured Rothia sp. TaxID=316088 RepID=UPI0025E95163|nr:hypothetical protein [uncultured Rothia sp.]
MNSYINPLAFRDRYAQDYYKVDRWPGWAVHAEQEILDIKGSLEPEVRKYVQVQDVLERLAGSGRLGVPNLQEVSVREGALAVFDSIVLPAWAVTLRVPHVVICGPELKNPDLQVARKMPAGWYGVTTSNLTLAVPELGMWATALLEWEDWTEKPYAHSRGTKCCRVAAMDADVVPAVAKRCHDGYFTAGTRGRAAVVEVPVGWPDEAYMYALAVAQPLQFPVVHGSGGRGMNLPSYMEGLLQEMADKPAYRGLVTTAAWNVVSKVPPPRRGGRGQWVRRWAGRCRRGYPGSWTPSSKHTKRHAPDAKYYELYDNHAQWVHLLPGQRPAGFFLRKFPAWHVVIQERDTPGNLGPVVHLEGGDEKEVVQELCQQGLDPKKWIYVWPDVLASEKEVEAWWTVARLKNVALVVACTKNVEQLMRDTMPRAVSICFGQDYSWECTFIWTPPDWPPSVGAGFCLAMAPRAVDNDFLTIEEKFMEGMERAAD